MTSMEFTAPDVDDAARPEHLEPATFAFYRACLQALNEAKRGLPRGRRLRLRPLHGHRAAHQGLRHLLPAARTSIRSWPCWTRLGCQTEKTFPHWLAKAYNPGTADFIDVIYSSGSGIAVVDDEWFTHSVPETVLGVPVRLCPAEEIIWSKGFIMERERYDGNDVAHLLRARGATLDWDRVLRRFGPHWRVLLSHLVLFGFIYPAERTQIPRHVQDDLLRRLQCGDGGHPARGQDVPGHADLASPVPGGHRALGIPRRAARARHQDDPGRHRALDARHRRGQEGDGAPAMNPQRETIRLAAVGDVHCTRTPSGALAAIFTEAASQADVLLLAGDLTDYGLPEEARALARELAGGEDPDPGRARQPRLRVRPRGRGREDPRRGRRADARRGQRRDPRRRLRGGEGILRRIRPPHARALGRGRHQGLRARGGGRGAQAGARPGPPAHARSGWPCSTTRRSRPPSRASRARSSRSSAPAASRSRSTATR